MVAASYQVKGPVPDAVSVVELPAHTMVLPVTDGEGITVTSTLDVAVQPVALIVPVTVHIEVAEGVKVMEGLFTEYGADH